MQNKPKRTRTYSPSQVQALQAKWDQKLAKEGLGSIEDAHGQLHSWDSLRFLRRPQQVLSAQEYYYRAGQFATNHGFPTKREGIIWTMHANGDSLRDIAAKLNIDKMRVSKVVNLYKIIMLGLASAWPRV